MHATRSSRASARSPATGAEYQMSSQMTMPTRAPAMSSTIGSVPARKYRASSNTP